MKKSEQIRIKINGPDDALKNRIAQAIFASLEEGQGRAYVSEVTMTKEGIQYAKEAAKSAYVVVTLKKAKA